LNLVDHILQRVAPYIRRNPPLDILDLWPTSGIWSSKINEFLQPRRHVLVEPEITYHRFLKPLVQSKPCYKLLKEPIYGKADWAEFIPTHFPEQSPIVPNKPGVLPKNNTLLILANPPAAFSPKDHYTPSRWWLKFLEDCLHQNGLNMYGSVRVLALAPFKDITGVLPRTTADRRRIGSLTETLALHAIEIASSNEFEHWHASRGWDALLDNRKRVAERAAAQNIITPPNREPPPLECIPDIKARGRKESPYTARMLLPLHKELLSTIEAGDATGFKSRTGVTDPKLRDLLRQKSLAVTKLARNNTMAYSRQKLTDMRLNIDEETRKLARAAADPNETPENLKILDDQIGTLQSQYAAEVSKTHFSESRFYESTIDDSRIAFISNNFDDSQLVWDRRPFEPLVIHPDEIWPADRPMGLIYFEAQEAPLALQKIFQQPKSTHREALDRFLALINTTNGRTLMTVSEIAEFAFSKLSTNELVRAIPSLATFANKRIKPGSGPMPLGDPALDPVTSYQDNLDYDLSEVRLRILSMATIGEMVVEYEKVGSKLSAQAFNRLLGGALTTAQLGVEVEPHLLRRKF
jgi:transcription factor 1